MTDFEEIISLAEDIKTSEEPNSITASMVGTEFLRLAEYARYILDKLHAKTDKLTNEEIDSWNALAAKVEAIIKDDPTSPLAIEIASRTKAGIVKIGKGLEVLADGTINVTSSGGVEVDTDLNILKVKEGDDTYYCGVSKLEAPNAPTLTAGGTFPLVENGTKVVTITNNQGGKCYYTTDGTNPTTKSASFSTSSVTVTLTVDVTVQSKATTVKAMVVKNGLQGATASETYTLKRKVATPTITAGSDEYASSRSITIASTSGASIKYSIDGTAPSTAYSSAFSISSSKTVKANATLTGWEDSDTAEKSVTVGRLKMYYKAVASAPTTVAAITAFTSLKEKTFPREITFAESGLLKGCFCYDKDLGDLTSIIEDSTKYEKISLWTKTEVGNYNVYTANDAANFQNAKYKFIK